MESRAFIVGLIVGILATVTMDVVAVIALRLGIAGRGHAGEATNELGICLLKSNRNVSFVCLHRIGF
jgi:hypothetical protein